MDKDAKAIYDAYKNEIGVDHPFDENDTTPPYVYNRLRKCEWIKPRSKKETTRAIKVIDSAHAGAGYAEELSKVVIWLVAPEGVDFGVLACTEYGNIYGVALYCPTITKSYEPIYITEGDINQSWFKRVFSKIENYYKMKHRGVSQKDIEIADNI